MAMALRSIEKAWWGSFLLVVLVGSAVRYSRAQETRSPAAAAGAAKVAADAPLWKSQTTGNEYRLQVEGTTLRAERVNIPKDSAHQGAYVRTTARRQGSKWVGKTEIFLPCAIGHGPVINRCHLVMGFEITQMSADRISGRIEDPDLNQFDCKSCNAPKTAWKDFVWVRKKQ